MAKQVNAVKVSTGIVKQRRTRKPDTTPELFPEFTAGIERAKRVRVILRKLAGWPAEDVALLVAALRERADPATAGSAGSMYPFGSGQKAWEEFKHHVPAGWPTEGTTNTVTLPSDAGQPAE